MPIALNLLALAPPSLDQPIAANPSPDAYHRLGSAGLVPLHQWPLKVKNRAEFVQAICPNPHVSADLKEYVALILESLSSGRLDFMTEGAKQARQIFEEIDTTEPDLQAQLADREATCHAAYGECLTPIVSSEAVIWTADDTPIARGDLVAFAARGMPMAACKFFFGISEDVAVFWCPQPDSLFAVRLDLILHVSSVAWVKEVGKQSMAADMIDAPPHYTPMARHFESAAPVAVWENPPRLSGEFNGTPVSGLMDAITIVHAEIAEAMLALPEV